MKEMIIRIRSFITFETPLQTDILSHQFKSIHASQQDKFDSWSTTATRFKMIYNYWYNSVMKHFSFLILTAVSLTFTYSHHVGLLSILSAGLVAFPVFYFFHYKPFYYSVFLPNLEMIKEDYEQSLMGETKKCRQAQLPNFTLLLVHYVSANANDLTALACNDNCALMLTKLYGVDSGSMKKCLELLLIKSKRKTLTERRKTELKNRFNEAYDFLEEMALTERLLKLKELEMNFFS